MKSTSWQAATTNLLKNKKTFFGQFFIFHEFFSNYGSKQIFLYDFVGYEFIKNYQVQNWKVVGFRFDDDFS